jgi:hypothetical protein
MLEFYIQLITNIYLTLIPRFIFIILRFYSNLHVPIVNITKYDKGVYITGIKAFSYLPQAIKSLANNEKSFKSTLKRFHVILFTQ